MDTPLRDGLSGSFGCRVWRVISGIVLIAFMGCSSVQVDVVGSAPDVTEMGLADSRPDVLRVLGSALVRRGLRVVDAETAAYQISTELTWKSRDARGREPIESWVRGGVSGDPQYGGGAPWIEFGRETDYSLPAQGSAPSDREWTALTLSVASRREGRVVWRGTYKDWSVRHTDAAEWASWLENAASALIQRMTTRTLP